MSKLTMFTARRCRVQRIPPRLRGDRVAGLAGASRQLGANCIPPVASLDGGESSRMLAYRMQIECK